jgi:hypothetical protein
MSDEDRKEWNALVLVQLRQSYESQQRIFEKLDEQGETLKRLTITVEEHKNYSRNLELEQKRHRTTMNTMKEELDEIQDHVNEVKVWVKILKPTKLKALILAMLLSALGGSEVVKSDFVTNLIKGYIQVVAPAPSVKIKTNGAVISAHPAESRPVNSESTAE